MSAKEHNLKFAKKTKTTQRAGKSTRARSG